MTKRYAVLGSPITHSKSPTIHNAAFSALGVDAEYVSLELGDNLEQFLASQPADFQGFSVTMPLKEQALNVAERVDSLAIASGAANTLIRTESGWDAFNTDVFGIQMALAGRKFKSVSILGTGATARSAIVAMQELDKNITIWGRNSASIKQLTAEYEVGFEPLLHKAVRADLVIATLPPRALDEHLKGISAKPSGLLLDVAYDPWPSKAADLWGPEKTISGLEMLIWQAVGQQRLFAGNDLSEALNGEKELLLAVRSALDVAK
jgi:shikimate dehydrogenase